MPERASMISLADAERPIFVGIDVGGTNIKIGLVDNLGKTLAYHSIPTNSEDGPENACERIADGVSTVLQHANATKEDVARIGLATPNADIQSGNITKPGNLPTWWNFPIRQQVSERCGLPVRYANDANAAAYGEFWGGAGSAYDSMILLTLGTGVGGGVIIGDLLIEGDHSCGGECGHILVDPSKEARKDSLGKPGSLEAYCGSYAIVNRALDALATGRESSLQKIKDRGQEITPLEISKAAEAGDELAEKIVMDTAYYLGLGIVSLVHTIDPTSIVIGGGVSFGGAGHPLGEKFLERIRDEVRPRLLPTLRESLHIDFAQLGGDAGYIGSAGLARLEHMQLTETN